MYGGQKQRIQHSKFRELLAFLPESTYCTVQDRAGRTVFSTVVGDILCNTSNTEMMESTIQSMFPFTVEVGETRHIAFNITLNYSHIKK